MWPRLQVKLLHRITFQHTSYTSYIFDPYFLTGHITSLHTYPLLRFFLDFDGEVFKPGLVYGRVHFLGNDDSGQVFTVRSLFRI